MARTLSSAMSNAISDSVVRPVLLLDLDFSTPIYFWSGYGDLNFASNDYIGVGDLLNMSVAEETQDLGASGLTLTLSGINGTELLTKALSEDYQGSTVDLRLGAMNEDGTLIANPVTIFAGTMDVMTMQESGEQATITLKVENKLQLLSRTKVRRYTNQDQKAVHPNDKGFEYVTNIAEKDITWGAGTEKAASQQLQPPPRIR